MRQETNDDAHERAVSQLTELGLGVYAARTFVALTLLSGGTAVDVSQTTEVPRTRVYDAAEELIEWGLVEVDGSTPQSYTPVDSGDAGDVFIDTYRTRVEALRDSLSSLERDRPRR